MMTIPIEISARHIHLSPGDWRKLFPGDGPREAKPISQPPQFVAVERVRLEGPAGHLDHVGLVGPLRAYTQVELAPTDARHLGVQPPLSDSGKLAGAAELAIIGSAGSIRVPVGIIQQRHIHASVKEAQLHGLHDGQEVSVRLKGPRGGIFDHVLVRVNDDFRWTMHVDTDEGNAFGLTSGVTGEILP